MRNNTRRIAITCAAALLGAGAYAGATAIIQPDDMANGANDADAMMEAWMAANTPGPHHKALANFRGEWNAVVNYRYAEGMPVNSSEGVMRIGWAFGGEERFLMGEYQGDIEGMPFKGIMMLGYSNATKSYQSLWVDSMTTHMTFDEGTCNDDHTMFTFHGTEHDPMTGQAMRYIDVIKFDGPDKHTLRRHNILPDGSTQNNFWIEYTRRK